MHADNNIDIVTKPTFHLLCKKKNNKQTQKLKKNFQIILC